MAFKPPQRYINWGKVPLIMDVDWLAFLLDLDPHAARKLLREEQIPGAKKIGGQWRIERDTLQRHFEGELTPPRISDADARRIAEYMALELIRVGKI